MYVRWKRRVRAHKPQRVGYWMRDPAPPHVTRAAQLVESRRVNGQPRQHVVAHLATIRRSDNGELRHTPRLLGRDTRPP